MTPRVFASGVSALAFLTSGLSPAMQKLWPLSGIAVILLSGFTMLRLTQVWVSSPEERARAAGLLLFLGSMASLALGLGLSRLGFEIRYVILAVPAWCCVYFVCELYGGGKLGKRVPALLAVAAVATLWPNVRSGIAYARQLRAELGSFERDLVAGVPRYELIRRYRPWLHNNQDLIATYLGLLQRARVGPYVALQGDPPFRIVTVPLDPITRNGRPADSSTGSLIFELPSDCYAMGIRVKFKYQGNGISPPLFELRWKSSSEADFTPERSCGFGPTGDHANWEWGALTRPQDPEVSRTIWISDTPVRQIEVRQLELTPSTQAANFQVTELSLLIVAP